MPGMPGMAGGDTQTAESMRDAPTPSPLGVDPAPPLATFASVPAPAAGIVELFR